MKLGKTIYINVSRVRPLFLRVLPLVMLLLSTALFSQSPSNYILKKYNNTNGLDQESVSLIMMDSDGFLWMGNNSGCVRFDGISFTFFSLKENNRFIRFFRAAGSDSIYILDHRNFFYRIVKGRIKAAPDLTSIYAAGNFMINPFTNEFFRFNPVIAENEEELRAEFEKVKRSAELRIFVTPQKNVYKFVEDKYKTTLTFLTEKKIRKIYLDKFRVEFRFLLNDTLCFLNNKGNFSQVHDGKMLNDIIVTDPEVRKLIQFVNKNSRLSLDYIRYRKKRIYVYQEGSLSELVYSENNFHIKKIFTGLPPIRDVVDIMLDEKRNTYYIASLVEGLYAIRNKNFVTIKSNHGFLYENNIRALQEIAPDSILSGRNGILYTKAGNSKLNLTMDDASGIGRDRKGHLFFSHSVYNKSISEFESRNIYVAEPGMRNPRQIHSNEKISATLSGFYQDTNRDFYISDATSIYKYESDSLRILFRFKFDVEALFGFVKRKNDDFIIGTNLHLLKLNLQTKRVDTLLNNVMPRALYNDANGYTWIGTYGQGIYIIDPKNKLHHLPLDHNKSLEFTHCFIPDANADMWSSTNNGLFRYQISAVYRNVIDSNYNIRYYRYDNNDGLETNEFNGGINPCGVRASDGSVYLASIAEIVAFKPENVFRPDNTGDVYFDDVRVDGRSYNTDSALVFPNTTALIAMHIMSSKFGIEKNNFMEYRISGISDTWIQVDPSGSVSLNGLKSGTYSVTIRKEANAGYIYRQIDFTILPFFYETLWFKIVTAFFVITIFFFFYKSRIRRLKKIQSTLEDVVKTKTASLSSTVEELTVSRKELEDSYDTIQKVTGIVLHDLRSPLRYLSMVATNLVKTRHELSEKEVESNLVLLNNTCSRIFHFTNDILGWLMANNKEIITRHIPIDVAHIIHDMVEIYQDLAKEKNNEIIVNVADPLMAESNPDILAIIIRNVIDNAIKYTKNGKIYIDAGRVENEIYIKIRDTGKGFDSKKYFNLVSGKLPKESTMGIRIIDELAKKLSVKYAFESEAGKGTIFSLFLPAVAQKV